MNEELSQFVEALGLSEEPYGIFYTDVEPAEGFSPAAGPPVSAELERQGKLDIQGLFKNFSCVLGKLWLARRKNTAAYFDAERFGCPGGAFYLGFYQPHLNIMPCHISTGIPGVPIPGERYVSSPEAATRYFTHLNPRLAPARFCVFKPLSQFSAGERPELVTFFARGEVLVGLCNLVAFVTDDWENIAVPFGSGCSFVVTWPLHYLTQGKNRAVLGCGDPSDRPHMRPDEMPLTVPYAICEAFLARWRDSFLLTETWNMVKKKIVRSKEVWGELP